MCLYGKSDMAFKRRAGLEQRKQEVEPGSRGFVYVSSIEYISAVESADQLMRVS